MTRASILLLLVAAGATMAYVSPDDQTRSKTGYRGPAEVPAPAQVQRQRPKPLSASDVFQLEQAKREAGAVRGARGARGAGARRVREIDTSYHVAGGAGGGGAYASSGAGSFAGTSGQFQPDGGHGNAAAAFGAAFGPAFGFQANPFQNQQPGNNNFAPFDFNSFFQHLQQIQQSIGQYGLNQAGSGPLPRPPSTATHVGGNVPSTEDLHANLPAFITLKNGTEVPLSVVLAAYSSSLPASSHQNHGGNAGFGQGNDANVAYNQIGTNFEGAAASASLGPNGGYGSANLIPDIGNRFGAQSGQFGPPSGGNVGVFTSSSSGTSDVNGQRQTFKTATSGVNDNGKITTFTVRDPPQ